MPRLILFIVIALLFCLELPQGRAQAAYGQAPWCAVINLGTGEIYWDCQYATFESCVPNVLAGNRGFCNVNPYWQAANPGVAPPTRVR